ncbi:MAG TPA: flavodoxin domain-containing protein [Lachnospiraceae bacterium]|nr:flavodoxin domain-containing protein [Lachnospiraceae bacterium]
MNTKLIFASKTGHSKKIAVAIEQSIKGKALNVLENPVINNTDLLIIVGGIYAGESSKELLDYAKTIKPGAVRKAILVTSSCSKSKSQITLKKILVENKVDVVDEYKCKGSFLFFGLGHPNKSEIAGAVEFVKKYCK